MTLPARALPPSEASPRQPPYRRLVTRSAVHASQDEGVVQYWIEGEATVAAAGKEERAVELAGVGSSPGGAYSWGKERRHRHELGLAFANLGSQLKNKPNLVVAIYELGLNAIFFVRPTPISLIGPAHCGMSRKLTLV